MKKLAILFVAALLIVAMTVPTFAAGVSAAIETDVEVPPTRYLHLTAGSENSQGQLTVRIDGSKITAGETYTVKVTMKFENITGQYHAYTNIYNYKQDTFPNNFDGLGAWGDFASLTSAVGGASKDWKVYTSTYVADTPTACVTIGFGFYLCAGTIYIADISLTDSQGNVVFADDFSNGLDENVWKQWTTQEIIEGKGQEWDPDVWELETVKLHGYTAPEPETSEPEVSEPATELPPETGDTFTVFALMALIALAGASAVVVKARKN